MAEAAGGEAGGAGAAGGAEGASGGGAGGAGAGGAEKAYYESFADEAIKTSPSVQRYKTVEDLAKGYVNLEKRFGVDPAQRLDLPADMNDAEAMKAVFAKLGMPEKADGYGIKLADDASDADKAMLGKATEAFHKANLTTGQAKVIGAFINEQTTALAQAQADAFKAQAAEGKAALQKDWGVAYEPKTKEIGNLLAKYGDEALVKELDGDKLGNYPNLARFLGKVLDRMAEPGAAGGGSGDAGGVDRPMTPAQASAAIATLNADPVKGKALMDSAHPLHKTVVEERNRLLAMRDGKATA